MGVIGGSLPICPSDQHCSEWAQTYMKYCLCSVKDEISLLLGTVSVISWGIAEIPQIVTNYKQKSSEAMSMAFLITWIIGDLLNLFGCLLEPATLPTQYYMAMLFTATTIALTAQTIYYRHVYPRITARKKDLVNKRTKTCQEEDELMSGLIHDIETEKKGKSRCDSTEEFIPVDIPEITSSPKAISTTTSLSSSLGRDLYYMSARSLSTSHNPLAGSYLTQVYENQTSRSCGNERSIEEPLLGTFLSQNSAPTSTVKSMLCVVPCVFFLLGSSNFLLSNQSTFPRNESSGLVLRVGRKILQIGDRLTDDHIENVHGSGIGTCMGWIMATIYMTGRLPQICLNFKRGDAEGLSFFMFIFALIGNCTYVASILVSSMNWIKIRPNLPWLFDAAGCILLDSIIVSQFIYFWFQKNRRNQIHLQ